MAYQGVYNPNKQEPYKLSRSKIDLFLSCRRCFYLDRRLGIIRPPGFPFNLNSAVDSLLKNEFDTYRNMEKPHPYMLQLGIDAVPFKHDELGKWRANFTGISHVHQPTNFHLFGAVDDIWRNVKTGELIVVDYKATSKASEVNIDSEWQMSYKYQMEFYQYLLRKNGFPVSDMGYFVYCNGVADNLAFNEQLKFRVSLIPYEGGGDWIEDTIMEIHSLLNQETIPAHSENCPYCNYQRSLKSIEE